MVVWRNERACVVVRRVETSAYVRIECQTETVRMSFQGGSDVVEDNVQLCECELSDPLHHSMQSIVNLFSPLCYLLDLVFNETIPRNPAD